MLPSPGRTSGAFSCGFPAPPSLRHSCGRDTGDMGHWSSSCGWGHPLCSWDEEVQDRASNLRVPDGAELTLLLHTRRSRGCEECSCDGNRATCSATCWPWAGHGSGSAGRVAALRVSEWGSVLTCPALKAEILTVVSFAFLLRERLSLSGQGAFRRV